MISAGSSIASGTAPTAGGGVQSREPLEQLLAGARRSAASTSARAAAPPVAHVSSELVERRVHLEPRELEDVVAVLEEAVRDEQGAELADLVPPAREEPVVAEELVLLDVREDRAREREQLVEPLPRLVVEQRAVLLGEPVALAAMCSVGRSMSSPAFSAATWPISDAYGMRRVVEPAAVGVVEAVARRHVEPGVLDLLELGEPRAARVALGELGVDLRRRAALDERAVDAGVDREPRQAAQLGVGPEEQHVDAGDHLRDVLVGDVRQVRLAELGERHVRAVAEQQELEVVLPHQVGEPQRVPVRVEHGAVARLLVARTRPRRGSYSAAAGPRARSSSAISASIFARHFA